jgi:hypothetical protein
MPWVKLVLLVATRLSAAVTVVFVFAFGLGWYALGAGRAGVFAGSMVVAFVLGDQDRSSEIEEPGGQQRRARQRQAADRRGSYAFKPALANATKASLVERASDNSAPRSFSG